MIKYKVRSYRPEDLMSELILVNFPMLLVVSRFGVELGFGESTIEQCCKKNNIDTYTFLAVVNILSSENRQSFKVDYTKVDIELLVKYLNNSHSYFLDYRLPSIRAELDEALESNDDASIVILNYYDEYIAEVTSHITHEEEVLFPFSTSLIATSSEKHEEHFDIEEFCQHHEKVEDKLSELKGIIVKYYRTKTTNKLNSVLYDIFSCECELSSHNIIEDFLLVPTIKVLESNKK